MTRDAAQARKGSADDAFNLMNEGTRAEDLAAARANFQVAEANFVTAKTSLTIRTFELRAPDDGVILSRVREPGAMVSPSDDVLVLSLNKPVVVRAYISEPDLGRIHASR
jgi:HlyD family secretion protein